MLFIDNLLIIGSSDDKINETKTQLRQQYEMKDLGLISRYLSIQVDSLSDGYFLHQTDYIEQLLCEVGMSECHPSSIPLPEGTVLLSDMSSPQVDAVHYSRIVGKLIYLTNT